jgi:glucose/arabinose dehydrogenase
MRKFLPFICALLFLFSSSSCYRMRSSEGGGEIKPTHTRQINTNDIAVPAGYKVEAVATGLNFPTDVAFDEKGNVYVIQAGYSYGEAWGEPKLIKIENSGTSSTIATGGKNGPWNGFTFYDGNFYVAEGGEAEGGKILKISMDGKMTALIEKLPSIGDHHTNGPVINDGYIYFGQGTATNSAVVGTDNADFGWLKRHPDFHDIPCSDITLNGINYDSENIFDSIGKSKATTGAYSAFNHSTTEGQIIKGAIPCSGSIMRIPLSGATTPELVAWGFRNPFGLSFSPDKKLFITENAFDERGSRPIWGAGDVLWEVKEGSWYGWPDYSAGSPVYGDEEFHSPGKPAVKALLKEAPGKIPKPVAVFAVHSSSNGFDFSRNNAFGFAGQAFVAQFGDMAPKVGKVLGPVGFKVVRVDVTNGVIEDFFVNRNKLNGPATLLKSGGIERPVAAKFNAAGDALYIVDFGILRVTENGPEPVSNTGVIWKVSKIK